MIMNYLFADVEYEPITGKIYYPDDILLSISPYDAMWYYQNVSPNVPGLDISFYDENLYVNKYFNFEFYVDFPTIDPDSEYNKPYFEFYVGDSDESGDFIARFVPVYSSGITSWSSTMFTEQFVKDNNIESYVWQYASEGWVGFSLNFKNLEPQLTSNEYELTDIKSFGLRFYIYNPDQNHANWNQKYTFGIRNVSCGSTPKAMTEGKIYYKSFGNGKVWVNGKLIR